MTGPTSRQLVAAINSMIARATSRRYAIALDLLDDSSLRELMRLLRDLEEESRMAARRAQLQSWRRP
jgi:hypothetical protein